MKIILAKSSGFCMGVRRAMEMALDAVHNRAGPIYSYGPLIHNPQALDLLKTKGLNPIESEDRSWNQINSGTVIIRAHGVPPAVHQDLAGKNLEIIDATCPRVLRVQAIIKKHTGQGAAAIIWGNADHPEVIGLLGCAGDRGHVIRHPKDVADLPDLAEVILVAQTTQNQGKFPEMIQAVLDRWPQAHIFDTICGATQRRQDEVRHLARQVQAMVIVGGHASGNTERLAAVAREQGVKTIQVETEAEVDADWLRDVETVGVSAGASTPNWMIKRVLRHLERIARKTDRSVKGLARRILRAMILSNTYAALGAGAMSIPAAWLQNRPPSLVYFGVVFFYIHAMHMLNVYLDKEASKFNDPDRAIFLEKHKKLLVGAGAFSAVIGLTLSLTLSVKVFVLLMIMSCLGLLYAVPLVPEFLARHIKLRRLKDVPSSKTISMAGGWAVTISLIPALAPGGRVDWGTAIVGLVIFILVFIGSALNDILEIQGDRIVGRETIPIIIGEKNTLNLLTGLAALVALVLVIGWALARLTSLALVLLCCAAYTAMDLFLFRRGYFINSVFFEALIAANFLLAGALSLLWAWWGK